MGIEGIDAAGVVGGNFPSSIAASDRDESPNTDKGVGKEVHMGSHPGGRGERDTQAPGVTHCPHRSAVPMDVNPPH
jgi:hypothetical protein